jgi:hypothetical protein
VILFGLRPYPIRGVYGKKDLENANMKAPGGIGSSIWSLLSFDSGTRSKFNLTVRREATQ